MVGTLPVDNDFLTLGADEIYRYSGSNVKTVDYSHMVLFVGYGFEGGLTGKRYLVFLTVMALSLVTEGSAVYILIRYSEIVYMCYMRMLQGY